MMPTLELRGCCFVGLRYGVAVANHNRCCGKRRCEVLAGSLPAEQPILPLEQVQGMTVGDRPGTHRLRDTSKEYHKGYKQQYHKMSSSFYPNDYG